MDAATKEKLDRDREKVRTQFIDQEISKHTSLWDDLWKNGITPWDRGCSSPALAETLANRKDLVGSAQADDSARRKRALVPGCGNGYDVALLASFGYDAYGLDASETVVSKCKQLLPESIVQDSAPGTDVGRGRVKFLCGDFFTKKWESLVDGGVCQGFDIIFDYTFLCALPPALRPKWARRQWDLLAKNGGRLICLEFPTQKPPSTGGPPWAVPPLVYQELFARPGEAVSYDEAGNVQQHLSLDPNREALIRMAHWQPERTHPAGQGTDWVSIWRHQKLES